MTGSADLDEVVARWRRAGRMLLEISVDAGAPNPGIEEGPALLDRHGMALHGRHWSRGADVAACRELRPDIATCALYLGAFARGHPGGRAHHAARGGRAFIGVGTMAVDAAAVAEARRRGSTAVDGQRAAGMQRVIDSGAAILITDQPDLAKTLLKR